MFTIQNLATVLSIIIIAGYLSYKEIREYRARRNGLAGNPTRCQGHADAINEIRGDIKRIKEILDIV
jgi:hypothetical protein